MRRLVYVQCIDGEYFRGPVCPSDGWSSPLWDRVAAFDGRSLDDLAQAGLLDDEIAYVLVVEQHPTARVHDVLFILSAE